MRGSQTEPKRAEEAKALVAQTNNISAVSRLLEIPRETIRDIVLKDDEFAEFRQQVQKEYIVKTWGNILEIESALAGKIKKSDLSRLPLREITGALKDLKQSVESVLSNININNLSAPIPILGGMSLSKKDFLEKLPNEMERLDIKKEEVMEKIGGKIEIGWMNPKCSKCGYEENID